MKVLYAALRHDPRDIDQASSVDYLFYNAFLKLGAEMKIAGPFNQSPPLLERLLARYYRDVLNKRYVKWKMCSIWRSGRETNRIADAWNPDLVFSLFPPPLAMYRSRAPVVYCTDTTFWGWQEAYKRFNMGRVYGKIPFWINSLEETVAFRKATRIITHSAWCKDEIVEEYGVSSEKVSIVPMPSALPPNSVPEQSASVSVNPLRSPIEILLVGRDYKRKGVELAIEVIRILNTEHFSAHLTVCGLPGESDSHVTFVGPYSKQRPAELREYMRLYQEAHFLIHPALFEAAGIVPSEAAAFGTPTITNNVGGLGTTVMDGFSGIVLPKSSPPREYAKAIAELVHNPQRYQVLRKTTRKRYMSELSFDAFAEALEQMLKLIVS